MFFEMNYLLYVFLPGLVLMGLSSWLVRSAMSKWSKVRNSANLTGSEVAQMLMRHSGLLEIRIEQTNGGDHYDPTTNVLRLTPAVANQPSVTAMAVAAHEFGHALQKHENYPFLALRSAMVPAVNIGSQFGWWLIFGGLMLASFLRSEIGITIAWVGLAAFALTTAFSLITLPVEFDASYRALKVLNAAGLMQHTEERKGAQAVLRAAALTYVAAAAQSLLQLLYFYSRIQGSSRRR